jgi:DNA (cytosine-5)-methyltransferase 1
MRYNLNGLAICSGIGGLELGLGFFFEDLKTVCYIEREAFGCATIVQRMEDGILHQAPIWDDLTTFDGSKWCGKIDLITAGFPCQPFSYSGKRKTTEDERWLWDYIFGIIKQTGTPIIFLENVPGLLSGGLHYVLRDFASIGFNAEWEVVSSSKTGAPHIRERVFVLAYSSGIRLAEIGINRYQSQCCEQQRKIHSISKQSSESIYSQGSTETSRFDQNGSSMDFAYQWPPGQRAIHKWRRIEEMQPEALPCLHGMADGIYERVDQCHKEHREDRVRALGNAVSPLTAALAISILWKRAIKYQEKTK